MKNDNRGRPTSYSSELANEICNVISCSGKGTKRLCSENPHWPCQDTLFSWLKLYPEFSEQYVQAKKCQAEFLVDEILDVVDDVTIDVRRARLQVDGYKWIACKLIPRVYGNRMHIDPGRDEMQDVNGRVAMIKNAYTREF